MANMPRRRPMDMLGTMSDPGGVGVGMPVGAEAGAAGLPGGDPALMGALGAPAGGTTEGMPTGGLEMLAGGGDSGGMPIGDEEVAQLEAMLEDPSVDEQTKMQIRAMLEEAARQSLAGLGGGGI